MPCRIFRRLQMKAAIKLMIVEDNPYLLANISDYMKQKSEVEVVGCASDGKEALEMMSILQPDAVITDIIMPQSDGMMFIEKATSGEYGNVPKIIVFTALSEESVVKRLFTLGIKYFIIKPVDMELLYSRILDLFDRRVVPQRAPQVVQSKSMDEKITSIFLSVGIPAHVKGYQYLREAIKMVIKNQSIINNITKELYPGVAQSFDTSPSKVERAIRHAIEIAWTKGRLENINTIFGYTVYSHLDKPTNGEFIALIADKLLLEQSA